MGTAVGGGVTPYAFRGCVLVIFVACSTFGPVVYDLDADPGVGGGANGASRPTFGNWRGAGAGACAGGGAARAGAGSGIVGSS